MEAYNHKKIEAKWQKIWEESGANKAEDDGGRKKYYCLVEFPYPSGDGLHNGHVRGYTAMDIIARKRRAEGYNVLFPIGWDAFGLPTENYAIKTKTPPQIVTKQNTDTFRRQLKSLGLSFDWSREINTTDPEYYKWTQWIFLQMFKHGLAYKKKASINWCLDCKIGLANEEVIDGKCERCGGPTEKREKEQWMLAITKYADRLYDDLDSVNYLEKIKVQQRNWIGRSQGAEISFRLTGFSQTNADLTQTDADLTQTDAEKNPEEIKVFTTRADTLFGATYVVIAPDHDLVYKLKDKIENWKEVEAYRKAAVNKTEIERTTEDKEKTGIRLEGILAVNPANQEKLPVFIADYVLSHYGTGAIMAVPAHDARDYEFAKKFNLPVINVIEPLFTQTTEPGAVRESEPFVEREAITAIVKHWKDDKYIGLRCKKVDWDTLITGGVEGGQTPEEAAIAEIKEETGFLNPRLKATLSRTHAKFYHVPKKHNRFAHFHVLYFELADGEKNEISDEENGNHEVVWLTREDMEKFRLPESHKFSWNNLTKGGAAYTGSGILGNSGKFNGMDSEEAKKKIAEFAGGKMETTYKLRDWVFSRQRYWGEPIPLIYCDKDGWVPVPEAELPVILPEVENYTPTDTGESPLAKIDSWVKVKCPKCGTDAKRETDTMPNWAGSSWYFLRYCDPKNDKELAGKDKTGYFMPVDWYNGGMEHTTLHVLYSRFWHKFLYDIGAVATSEPYMKRTSHGIVLALGGEKMSKSKGNVVNPDSIVETYGADTLRLYEMFMGPFDQSVVWSTESIIGPRRFIERAFRAKEKVSEKEGDKKIDALANNTVKKVTEDIESMSFNTAVSSLMIFLNEIDKATSISANHYKIFLRLLAPFAPHVAEELWEEMGNKDSIHERGWPDFTDSQPEKEIVTIVIQINGKVRGSFEAQNGIAEEAIKSLALRHEATKRWLLGKEPKRIVYVPGKLISIVT